jgi:hypothetical protein
MTVGSDFGFEIKLPANWTAVSKNDVKSKPDDAGTLVRSGSDVKETCSLLPGELSRAIKKPVRVHECRPKQLGNVDALYLVVDAYREGDKYIQYLIQKSPNRILMLTATSPGGKDFETMKSEFDDIMKSFKLM